MICRAVRSPSFKGIIMKRYQQILICFLCFSLAPLAFASPKGFCDGSANYLFGPGSLSGGKACWRNLASCQATVNSDCNAYCKRVCKKRGASSLGCQENQNCWGRVGNYNTLCVCY